MYAYGLFTLGLVIITIGSELLLRGASKIASLLGVRPIVIGLTIVSIGTSLPELAVGFTAIKEGAADMSIGNIAGTNLVNILLILGLSAAIRPLPIHINKMKFEIGLIIFTSFLLLFLSMDNQLSQMDGLIMLLIGITYLIVIIKSSSNKTDSIQKEYSEEYQVKDVKKNKKIAIWFINSAFLILGIALTVWGADLLVSGAVSIAISLDMSDAIIGLTIIAIGTSAPELITTLVATYKNDRAVAIGNILGSSITNILIILATNIVFIPNGIQVNKNILWFDLPLSALVTLVCYPVFKSDSKVSRTEGLLFVVSYIIYVLFLLYFRS